MDLPNLSPRRLWPFPVVVLVFLIFPSTALPRIDFRSDLSFVSRYIWRGFDTIADDRPVLEPSITFEFGESGVWFNAWSAFALADTDFVELDLVLGYDRAYSQDLSFSAGVGYFTFPSISGFPDKNSATPEAYTGVTLISPPLSLNLTFYYDFNMGDGLYTALSVSQYFRVKEVTVNSLVSLGYTRQYRGIGVDPGFSDICLGISTDLESRHLTLTPSLNYVIVPNETINDENEIWMGLTVGWSTNRSADGAD